MMSNFWIGAAILVALAIALMVWPLIRARVHAERSQKALNISLYRERMAELEQERVAGLIDEEQYEATRQELEAALLTDVDDGHEESASDARAASVAKPSRAATVGLVATALAVPGLAFLIHDRLYEPPPEPQQARSAPERSETETDSAMMQEMRALVRQLASRMEANPEDGQGWLMLAQSYRMLGDYGDAVNAYRQALPRVEETADLLTEYADSIIMANNGQVTAQAAALAQRALALDAEHQSALWLSGVGAFQAGDYAAAEAHWGRLLASLPGASEAAEQVRYARDSARLLAEQGQTDGAAATSPDSIMPDATERDLAEQQDVGPASDDGLSVHVELESALADDLRGDETVLVFARPANGSRMPLAVERLTVADLPRTVRLDASNAMVDGVGLDSAESLEVIARVSRDGMAEISAGDLEGHSGSINTLDALSRTIDIRIDTRIP